MEVLIESVDHEARGVGRNDNKVVFVENALPQEIVGVDIRRRKPSYETGVSTYIKSVSASRIKPRCVNFGVCGGCSFQHIDARTQLAIKQRVLEDALERIGSVRPEQILSPICGPQFNYRSRARLSCRYVIKKEKALVGFREKGKSYVVDMASCEVLPDHISRLLPELKLLVQSLSIRERVPQIEVACGNDVNVLAFRMLEDPSLEDLRLLEQFAAKHDLVIFMQRGGPATLTQIYPDESVALTYSITDMNLTYEFGLSEFTQVNTDVNSVLVRRAMSMLDLKPTDRVADLFCGLGNFSLAIARSGAQVIGLEANQELIDRAIDNAARNELSDLCDFKVANLFTDGCPDYRSLQSMDKLLIDPPRDGAAELIKGIGSDGPKKIVYVSCNPATLARDAGTLVHEHGYRLLSAGIVNMFPNTSHVESIALFGR
ncbi:MAG: 23S rRNA (uracil(1939)-C(5))-methyltransferase RlmD [Proteobacteria bacterium]|nr:23S rRNA (uracil(1939)-C(5))-methyltransferase RlmD [Pseudomonadota bacterium]MDA0862245.1 23S rRNA (uracil(1939)-C(5))-methyltransferase RlmD [Pseudomonadota bacterium]MDA1030667.1 23S rRNA (uracil(1939)-C(5))-methyltransferase RlmD [Pseudomonadota bacterium]